MATEAYRVLGQSAPAAATLTDVLTVPAGIEAVISSLVVCNLGNTATSFRVSVAINGAADSDAQQLYYDVQIPANDTFVATVGITLDDSDIIRFYSANGRLSINLFGTLITP